MFASNSSHLVVLAGCDKRRKMAVVHYKFKNSVNYDSITFDGLSISLRDLKTSILKKKKMRAEDTDLQVINAQTGEGIEFCLKFQAIFPWLL